MKTKLKIFLMSVLCIANNVSAQQQTDTLSLFFAVDKSVIDSSNAQILDELVANKNIDSVRIYGYTDFLGNTAQNQKLSERRSENVYSYLVTQGFKRENIVFTKGKGVYSGSIEENRQDLSDKGIQAHRTVQVVYSMKSQSNRLSEENLVANNNIVLENILFYRGSSRFLPESNFVLKELLATMRKYPTLKIEIQGHICCESNNFRSAISANRAKAVYNYLVKKGIAPIRLTYKGFDSTRKRYPLEQNESEKRMNRRVEILILER